MTIDELQIQLDIGSDNKLAVLSKHAYTIYYGYVFVDSSNGQCYLFDKHGNIDDIRKVKSIENNTFYSASLKCIMIPDSVESIGNNAFDNCASLKSIMIPDSVKSIGTEAFWNCASLKSITIPDSIKSIGYCVFYGCTSLKSIIIPGLVKSIGEYAFYNCTSLNEVIFKGKTMYQIKAMNNYPWGIEDTSIIKCQMS